MSTQTKVKKTVKKATVNELDEEDQSKDLVKLGVPLVGISSSKFPPVEEMQKGLQDIEDLIENTKQAQQQKLTDLFKKFKPNQTKETSQGSHKKVRGILMPSVLHR